MSAFWEFTGNAIAEGTAFADTAKCKDSDGGLFTDVAGTMTLFKKQRGAYVLKKTYSDSCSGAKKMFEGERRSSKVVEYYCKNGVAKKSVRTCVEGCRDGRCVTKDTPIEDLCTKRAYSMAFILIGRSDEEFTSDRIEKLNAIKKVFSGDFKTATSGLASMDTSYPLVTIVDDGTLINSETLFINSKEVVKKFYEDNPDQFDFISIYSSFDDYNTHKHDTHENVRNYLSGLGTRAHIRVHDSSEEFGYTRKLLGVNSMSNIDFKLDTSFPGVSNILLHETGHQWCCYVGDNFVRDKTNAKLEIIQQDIHFYPGLQSPSPSGDPMRSDHWISNGDGTFRREDPFLLNVYHPFQLYFMGLLPKSEFSKKHTIYDAGIVGEDFNDQKAVFYKEISVNDIIAVEGSRKCETYFEAARVCTSAALTNTFDDLEEVYDFKIIGKEKDICLTSVEIKKSRTDPLIGTSMNCRIPINFLKVNSFTPSVLEQYTKSIYCAGSLVDAIRDNSS